MKYFIMMLFLMIFIIGCSTQIDKAQEIGESIEETVGEPEASEPAKQWEVYNQETGETEIVEKPEKKVTENAVEGDIIFDDEGELLRLACENAANEYPEWTAPSTDLIIWEDSDKKFNFRNSPEDLSSNIGSPVQNSEILVDMDFIGLEEVSYVKTKNDKWMIGLLKLNGLNPPTNIIIYEGKYDLDSVDISPINTKKYLVFSTKGNDAYLDILETEKSTDERLLEINSVAADNQKISASPKGNYAYLLYDKTLRIFEIISKSKIDEIGFVESVVWVGESYLLYSGSDGTFIYEVKTKKKERLDKIDSVSDLSFNPKEKGIIAYNSGSKGEVVNCQTWIKLNSLSNGKIETFASEKTAIIEGDGVTMYWRFKDNDWTLRPSHVEIPIYATVWKRY
ncbi:hypothetical protein JXB41_06100 [Candidatus Woesearchaeota archaeon]|nr:hypothetical protein [Candidatus Woesearchaeota archaeon]